MADAGETLRLAKYVILQSTVVPSLICDLLVFVHFARRWRAEILTVPQNHVILGLLIVGFIQKITDVTFFLYYLRWGITLQQSPAFCAIWVYIDYVALLAILQMLSCCCLERHLFVFHSTMMKKRWCLILFHYIPLVVVVFYAPLFYAIVVLFPSFCTNEWDYTLPLCGAACYLYVPALFAADLLLHSVLPIVVILCANALFLARFVWQKIRHQRPMQWARRRRMVIQLVFISVLYLIFVTPLVTVGLIQRFWIPDFILNITYDYLYFFPYLPNIFLPFAIVGSLPKMRSDLFKWMVRMKISCRHPPRTHPTAMSSMTDRHHPAKPATNRVPSS